ncbi:hypothetical protein AB0K05_25030 [Nonomuraea sp. NPDC049486]|uniref:hypothetical protein n=1 Tax=Nonomuraea sp. NPDC049486 TaxID=3155773 RepID=UPI003438FC05
MAQRNPEPELPDIPECDVEKTPDGFKVVHESGTTAHAPDARKARIAGLRLRVLADLARDEIMFRTGDPT